MPDDVCPASCEAVFMKKLKPYFISPMSFHHSFLFSPCLCGSNHCSTQWTYFMLLLMIVYRTVFNITSNHQCAIVVIEWVARLLG